MLACSGHNRGQLPPIVAATHRVFLSGARKNKEGCGLNHGGKAPMR